MSDEENPIKDYLFEYIEKSSTIQKLISEKKFDIVIDEIIENCYDEIILMDKKDEAVGILATGILHYLLTNALLNSQRKVQYRGLELDIVILNLLFYLKKIIHFLKSFLKLHNFLM